MSSKAPVGRIQDKLMKRYELEAVTLSDQSQCDPVRVLFGRDRLSMTQLLPVFDLREEGGGSGGGKDDAKSGNVPERNYFGKTAFSFCLGVVDKLYQIWNGDVSYFNNPEGFQLGEGATLVEDAEDDVWDNVYKFNRLGTVSAFSRTGIRIYPGYSDQLVDSLFENGAAFNVSGETMSGPWPAYKNVCYFIADEFRLGSSSTTPNIQAELQVIPKLFATDFTRVAGQSISEPHDSLGDLVSIEGIPVCTVTGDTFPPLIVYEYLCNQVWGSAKLTAQDIDLPSFFEALNVCIAEGIAISACIDSDTSLRDAISQVLEYCDGVLYLNTAGKISIKLYRYNDSTEFVINENSLLQEPEIEQTDDAWGVTKVSFKSRLYSYESTSVVFESPRYVSRAGFEIKTNEFDRPFAKSNYIASVLARKLANDGSQSSREVRMLLLPSTASQVNVGSVISLSFAKFNIAGLKLRVQSITKGDPTSPGVEVTGVTFSDRAWDVEVVEDYLPRGYGSRSKTPLESEGYYEPYLLRGDSPDVGAFRSLLFVEENPNLDSLEYYWHHPSYGYTSSFHQVKVELASWGVEKINEARGEGFSERDESQIVITLNVKGDRRKKEIDRLIENDRLLLTFGAYTKIIVQGRPTYSFQYLPITFEINKTRSSGARIISVEPGQLPYILTTNSSYIEGQDGEPDFYQYRLCFDINLFLGNAVFPRTDGEGFYIPSAIGFAHERLSEKKETNRTNIFQCSYDVTPSAIVHAKLLLGTELGYSSFTKEGQSGIIRKYNKDQNQVREISNPWGSAVTLSRGVIKCVTNEKGGLSVYPEASNEDAPPELLINSTTGAVSYKNGNTWTPCGNAFTSGSVRTVQALSPRYFVQFNASGTFEHVAEKTGIIHVNFESSDALEVTIPAASGAYEGDAIEVYVTASDGVEASYDPDRTPPQYRPSVTIMTSEESINMGAGMFLKLVCTKEENVKKWLPILLSKSN